MFPVMTSEAIPYLGGFIVVDDLDIDMIDDMDEEDHHIADCMLWFIIGGMFFIMLLEKGCI